MEWCREHKLRAIGGVWVTGMGASMAYNMTQKHLGPMTKLVHSRVYAQALTLGEPADYGEKQGGVAVTPSAESGHGRVLLSKPLHGRMVG